MFPSSKIKTNCPNELSNLMVMGVSRRHLEGVMEKAGNLAEFKS